MDLYIPKYAEDAALARAPERLLQRHRESIIENRESLLASGRLCLPCSRLLAWPPSCPQHGPTIRPTWHEQHLYPHPP